MAPQPVQPDALAQRVKAIACVLPLHDLEDRKSAQATDFSGFQVLELALHAIDTVALQMEFDSGARHDDVIDELARLAATQAPDSPLASQRKVAQFVLDGLINVGTRDRGFTVTYGTTTADGYQRRAYDFKLLAEVVDSEGQVYLRATTAAINVLIGAMDIDIESEQEAAELKLNRLLRTGKLDRAKIEAGHARHLTIYYVEQVRDTLVTARRDVRTVDWLDRLPKMLDSALGHVKARVEAESVLADHVIGVLETADDVDGKREAAELLKIVQECRNRHADLQRHLLRAGDEFRAEQDRQVLVSSLARPGLDVLHDLLEPAVAAYPQQLARGLDAFVAAVAGPPFLRSVRLADFVPELLRPPTERTALGDEIEEPDLVDVSWSSRFSDEQLDTAHDVLDVGADQTIRLSDALDAARATGDHDVVRLVAIMAVLAYANDVDFAIRDHQDRLLLAFDDGHLLEDPDVFGADLLLAMAALPTGDLG